MEKKKKRLEEMRSLNKPVRKNDIAEHALKYEQIRVEKIADQKKKLRSAIQADRERAHGLPTFKSVRKSHKEDEDSDDSEPKERPIDRLKGVDGILGI